VVSPTPSEWWFSADERSGTAHGVLFGHKDVATTPQARYLSVLNSLRKRLSYSNITATLALFAALGGTSYAIGLVDSTDVADNSLRSRDLRNNDVRSKDLRERTIRARDVKQDALGGGVIKESALGRVPRAADAGRLGGASAQDYRVRCAADTLQTAAVCIERNARPPDDFLGASSVCDNAGRGLPTLAQLGQLSRSHGPLNADGEWTSSVFLEGPSSSSTFDRLEALNVKAFGDVDHARVNAPNQHAFRCVALPSN
jgi:hypothetical protein